MCESAHPPHTEESKVQGCRSPVLNTLLALCEFLVALLHCESSHLTTALWLDFWEKGNGDPDPPNFYSCSWKHPPQPPSYLLFIYQALDMHQVLY